MQYLKGKEFLGDYVQRTLANLETIEDAARKRNDKAYEVTQLINSLLAMIVFPFERRLQTDVNGKWAKTLSNCVDIPKGETDAEKMLKNMRHAICHSHVLFESDNCKDANRKAKIKSVIFVSCRLIKGKAQCPDGKECDKCKLKNGSTEKPDFQLTIPVMELRTCVKDIASEIEKTALSENNKKAKRRKNHEWTV